MTRRRRRSILRALLVAVVVLAVVVLGALLAGTLLIDPNALKPRIEAAAARLTGRQLSLRGPIRISFGLRPRVVAEDIAIANSPDGSRPEMLHLARVEARIALLPLLAGTADIERLDLVQPDLLLEVDDAGLANWRLSRTVPSQASPATTDVLPAQGSVPKGSGIVVRMVHLTEGRIAWHDARSGQTATLLIPRLDAVAALPGGSIVLAGELVVNSHTFMLNGETGSAERLFDEASGPSWPVALVLQGEGGRFAIRGTFADPMHGRGYALQVDATATDLSAFAPFMSVPPPQLHDATLAVRLTDAGAYPALSALALHLSGLDLGAIWPGLVIARLDLTAPDLHQPAETDMRLALASVAFNLRGSIGGLAALKPGAPTGLSVPVQVIVTSATGSGPGPLQMQASVQVERGPLLTLRGSVAVQRLDLDTLLAALPASAGSAGHARPAAAALPPPARRGRIIPDQPIPLDPLRSIDANLQFAIAALQTGGVAYTDLAGHLVLQKGKLSLDPFTGQMPSGKLDARLQIDAAETAAPLVAVHLRAPTISLGTIAGMLGHRGAVDGSAAIDADLQGRGATLHALAANLTGHFALTIGEAVVENALLGATLGGILRTARLPEAALGAATGRTMLHCLELQMEARNGTATITAFGADLGQLAVQGEGTVELGSEALNLHLKPQLRGGPGIVVPVHIGGTLADPKSGLDAANAAREVLGGGAAVAPGCGSGGGNAGATNNGERGVPPKLPKPLDILRGLLPH